MLKRVSPLEVNAPSKRRTPSLVGVPDRRSETAHCLFELGADGCNGYFLIWIIALAKSDLTGSLITSLLSLSKEVNTSSFGQILERLNQKWKAQWEFQIAKRYHVMVQLGRVGAIIKSTLDADFTVPRGPRLDLRLPALCDEVYLRSVPYQYGNGVHKRSGVLYYPVGLTTVGACWRIGSRSLSTQTWNGTWDNTPARWCLLDAISEWISLRGGPHITALMTASPAFMMQVEEADFLVPLSFKRTRPIPNVWVGWDAYARLEGVANGVIVID